MLIEQVIKLIKGLLIVVSVVCGEVFAKLGQSADEVFDHVEIEFGVVEAITELFEVSGVEDLLKLFANRGGEVGLAEVDGFTHQGEACAGDHASA